jgi:hypothetical protein
MATTLQSEARKRKYALEFEEFIGLDRAKETKKRKKIEKLEDDVKYWGAVASGMQMKREMNEEWAAKVPKETLLKVLNSHSRGTDLDPMQRWTDEDLDIQVTAQEWYHKRKDELEKLKKLVITQDSENLELIAELENKLNQVEGIKKSDLSVIDNLSYKTVRMNLKHRCSRPPVKNTGHFKKKPTRVFLWSYDPTIIKRATERDPKPMVKVLHGLMKEDMMAGYYYLPSDHRAGSVILYWGERNLYHDLVERVKKDVEHFGRTRSLAHVKQCQAPNFEIAMAWKKWMDHPPTIIWQSPWHPTMYDGKVALSNGIWPWHNLCSPEGKAPSGEEFCHCDCVWEELSKRVRFHMPACKHCCLPPQAPVEELLDDFTDEEDDDVYDEDWVEEVESEPDSDDLDFIADDDEEEEEEAEWQSSGTSTDPGENFDIPYLP